MIKESPQAQKLMAGMSVPEQEAYIHYLTKQAREYYEEASMTEEDLSEIEEEHLETM